jgi:hypothetical protein
MLDNIIALNISSEALEFLSPEPDFRKDFGMKTLSTLVVLCLFVLTIGCGPTVYDLSFDYDRKMDFAKLETYDWFRTEPKEEDDRLVIERIKNAVNTELAGKGLRRVSSNPDFLIAIKIGAKVEYWSGGGHYYHGSRYTGGYGYSPRYAHRIEAGTLVLDFVDAKSKELVWRGEAKGVLEISTPEKMDALVNEVVKKVLANFPPPPSK